MMKRIIALLLALILTVGLLPTVALAADGENPTTDSGSVTKEASKDNLNLVKTVTKDGNNYKVTLDAWATGEVTSSSTPVPMDIILLLDQSGSMDDKFTSSSKTEYNRLNRNNKKIYKDYRNKLYIYEKSEYVKVKVEKETIVFGKNKYTYTWNSGSFVSYGDHDYPAKTFYYQTTNTSSQKKIDALKGAVQSFIGKVNEEATSKNVDHRVAIVGFASTKGYSGNYQNTELLSTEEVVNYASANANPNDYKRALVSAKTEKKRLSTAINRLDAEGDTYPEYGFDMANQIFAQYPIQAGENRQRVVIMFTDGYPAPAGTDDFNVQMANNAINNAKRCKDNNAKVYTIGIFDGADPSASIENYSQNGWLNEAVAANRYMHFSSSNYPSAMALNNGGTKGEGNFYFAASNADALNDIFDTISEEISTDTTTLDGSATIVDNIPGNFTIPAEASDIKVYTAKCTGKTGETLSWKERQASNLKPTTTTNTTTGVKSVSVTGFDYSDEWCGLDENNQPHGSKLIIEFTISHNNYGGTQPTNAGASIKDKAGKEVIKVDDPAVPVTISKPDDVFTQANEKTYDGTGFDIFDEVAKKADDLANGTNNAFVDIEVKITVDGVEHIYTIEKGRRSGTWNQTASPKTSPNVKDENKDGMPEAYEYPVTITFKDAAEGSTASNSTTATAKFTINYAEAKVKANNKSKKATEEDPAFDATVTGMVNGEKAEEKLTYTITRTDASDNTVGDHQTITPIGDTYQNNYKVTYETGTLTITKGDPTATEFSLTGKFQKTLNSNTADVPAAGKEFELSITGTAPTTNNTALTGNVTVAPTGSGTTFSDTKAFTFKSGTTGVTALTFTAPGEYKYEVKEVKPTAPVAGMQYDETIYTLTIEVTESNGALSITSAKVTKPGTTDMPEQVADLMGTPNDTFTITNTFTAAELPLDPPTDPVQGTAKIVKALSSDSDTPTVDLPFKASLTGGIGFARRVARATVKAGEKTADFSGFGTLVFTGVGVYEYVISEDSDNPISGVIYDQTRYTLKVDVRENTTNHELYINSAQYTAGQVEGNILTTPITFTNKYTKPENATVVSKTVVTDLLTLSSPMRNAIHNFESINETTILYPVANNGTNTLEVTKGTTTARLLYKISVDAGTQQSLWFDDANVDAFWYKVDEVAVSRAGSRFKVEFKNNVRTADIYVTVNHTLNFDKGECTVENAIGEIKATTTVTEKDPDKLYLDFSKYVQKELAATGSKTASDVSFRVIVNGMESPIMMYNAGEEEVSTYVEFDPRYSTVLDVNFASITGGSTETKDFTGSYVEIDQVGIYYFELNEEDGKRTGVTYDDSTYKVYVYVKREGDKLVVGSFDIYKDGLRVAGETITFHNTIDTGKDDYYPIIIPTIINKDTGMLNKTDHFAYVIGYPDGTVHPNGQITRAEVATIFFRLLRDEVRDGAFATSNTYSDVAYGKWYNNPISTMSALGIITGYPDGTFKPNKPITRAEFAAIAARFDETQSGKSATFSDVIGHWAAKEIGIAYYNDWIKGYPDGTFKPDQNITRAEAMTLINRVLERKPESPADLLTNMNKWTDNMDTSKWYYLDVQEATNSHGYTRKTFNYELWRQMLPDPDWSRYER
ncbi:MAG: S-layer homology domain-containing protein [Oscillospiraceae bacterium]